MGLISRTCPIRYLVLRIQPFVVATDTMIERTMYVCVRNRPRPATGRFADANETSCVPGDTLRSRVRDSLRSVCLAEVQSRDITKGRCWMRMLPLFGCGHRTRSADISHPILDVCFPSSRSPCKLYYCNIYSFCREFIILALPSIWIDTSLLIKLYFRVNTQVLDILYKYNVCT